MPDANLGELVSISEALAEAIQEVNNNRRDLKNRPISITIFNDSDTALKFLDPEGGHRHSERLLKLVTPVVQVIQDQTLALAQLGPKICLVFRWMPGHEHNIHTHDRADRLSRIARALQTAYLPNRKIIWTSYQESYNMRYLKPALARAHQQSLVFPTKRHNKRPIPKPRRAGMGCPTLVQCHLEVYLPISAQHEKTMPAGWSESDTVILGRSAGGQNVVMTVPTSKVDQKVFVSNNFNTFSLLFENQIADEDQDKPVYTGPQRPATRKLVEKTNPEN